MLLDLGVKLLKEHDTSRKLLANLGRADRFDAEIKRTSRGQGVSGRPTQDSAEADDWRFRVMVMGHTFSSRNSIASVPVAKAAESL